MSCGDSDDFIIPKGLPFDFTVQILEENSFLPQILDGFIDGSFSLINIDDGTSIAGVDSIALTKITEDVIDAVAAVEEETDLTVAIAEEALYYIDIGSTRYAVDYTDNGSVPTLNEVAIALFATMGVLPENITAVLVGDTITVKNILGEVNTVAYSNNIAKTRYVKGELAIESSISTFYNDNGYLQGTIPAEDTTLLDVSRGGKEDGYYLKALYQGVVQVNFSDNTIDKTGIVCKVYVVNTGN